MVFFKRVFYRAGFFYFEFFVAMTLLLFLMSTVFRFQFDIIKNWYSLKAVVQRITVLRVCKYDEGSIFLQQKIQNESYCKEHDMSIAFVMQDGTMIMADISMFIVEPVVGGIVRGDRLLIPFLKRVY